MAGSTVKANTPTNFSYLEPAQTLNGTGPGAPKNNKSALIFPLATAALGAAFAFAGRSDQQRIFGAVTCVTLLGEAAFACMIHNKKVTQKDNDEWPYAITVGTLVALFDGSMLAVPAHSRPNNPLTVKRIVPTATLIAIAELALKTILSSSKLKMSTENIKKIGIGLNIVATAAYAVFLHRTR